MATEIICTNLYAAQTITPHPSGFDYYIIINNNKLHKFPNLQIFKLQLEVTKTNYYM